MIYQILMSILSISVFAFGAIGCVALLSTWKKAHEDLDTWFGAFALAIFLCFFGVFLAYLTGV